MHFISDFLSVISAIWLVVVTPAGKKCILYVENINYSVNLRY